MADYSHRNPGEVEPRVRRRTQALEMKRDGATYQQIAEALNYSSKGHAYKDLQAALREANKDQALAAEEYRALWNERLEVMFAAIWPRAVGMDPDRPGVDLRSAEMILKIAERSARLNSADAPLKTDITVSQNVDTRIEEMLRLLGIGPQNQVIQGELDGPGTSGILGEGAEEV